MYWKISSIKRFGREKKDDDEMKDEHESDAESEREEDAEMVYNVSNSKVQDGGWIDYGMGIKKEEKQTTNTD